MKSERIVPEIYVGENGNWFVNGYDTGTKAQGETGKDGATPSIGENGNWYVCDTDTGVKAQGPKGDKGDMGVPGAQGLQGEKGEPGTAGPQGCQGPKGDRGDTGASGIQGATGSQGLTGPRGPQGPTGATGAQGLTGPRGDTGANGAQGQTGETGQQGATGPQGLTGPQGPQGPVGATGAKGEQGIQGPQGEPGPVNIANNLTTSVDGYALDARQGKVLKGQMDALNSKLSGFKLATVIVCSYITPTVLQTAVSHSISDLYAKRDSYAVSLTIMQQPGTPFEQVQELNYEIRTGNILVVNAKGSGFVNGHGLRVSIIVLKL